MTLRSVICAGAPNHSTSENHSSHLKDIMQDNLLTPQEAATLLKLSSARCLERWRHNRTHKEGLHYIRLGNRKGIRYVESTLRHWAEHRGDPDLHHKFCEQKLKEARRRLTALARGSA